MKEIIKYQAYDGTEFNDRDLCIKHEQMCDQVSSTMELLIKTPDDCAFSNGDGYIQQNGDRVIYARKNIIQICKDYYPELFDRFSGEEGPRSIIGRYIDDCCHSVINRAWYRFMCIDDSFREWGQPYFAIHPEEAKQICINKEEI